MMQTVYLKIEQESPIGISPAFLTSPSLDYRFLHRSTNKPA